MEQTLNQRLIEGSIESANFELTHLQFIHCIQLQQKFSEYACFLALQTDQRKYLMYSPIDRNPKNLWKFAIQSVTRILRQKQEIMNIFIMNFRIKIYYREQFKTLFKKSRIEKLLQPEQELYHKILYLCNWEDLVEWEYSVLEELHQQKKNDKPGWLWFMKKQEKELFVAESYTDIMLPPPAASISTILTLTCNSAEIKLATYSISNELIQSQTLSLTNCKVLSILNDSLSKVKFSIGSLHIEYFDQESKDTLLRLFSQNDSPSMQASLKLYSDIKTANQVKYQSQLFEIYANPKAVSHLINFVSLKALSEVNKKNIVDRLKQIQEKALNQITDIFYYKKTYKIVFNSPSVKVFVPSQGGTFLLSLEDIRFSDKEKESESNYTGFESKMNVEVKFANLTVVPKFLVGLQIGTLDKIFLRQKWESKESAFDGFYDIEIYGMVDSFEIFFYTILVEEFKYLESHLKFYETNETLLMNKASIIKEAEKITPLTLDSGFMHQTCVAVLTSDTIYFFQNQKSTHAFTFWLLSNSAINRTSETIITISKSNKSIKLEFTKESLCDIWFYKLLPKVEMKITQNAIQRYEKEVLKFEFKINSTKAKVISNDMVEQYNLQIASQNFSSTYSDSKLEFSIKTESCSIKNQFNQDIFYFGSEQKLETIDLKFYKKDSKFYRGQDIEIFVDFKSCHLFFSKSALSQMLQFQSSFGTKEIPSEKVEENIMKVLFSYNINQIMVDFYKDIREVGRFSLGTLAGKLTIEGSTACLDGDLSSMRILWIDKITQNYATLVDLSDELNFKYGLTYNKDLIDFKARLVSTKILYIPNVVKSVKGYFRELANVGQGKGQSQSTQAFKADIVIENFKFAAKKRLVMQEKFDFNVSLAKIQTFEGLLQVELGRIQGESSHLLFNHEKTVLSLEGKVIKIQSFDVGLYLSSFDLNYLLNFFDPVIKENEMILVQETKKYELEMNLVIHNLNLQLLDSANNFTLVSQDLEILLNGNEEKIEFKLFTHDLSCLFLDKPVFAFREVFNEVLELKMSENIMELNIEPLEFYYNSVFISFIKEFIDVSLAVQVSIKTDKPPKIFDYVVKFKNFLILIGFNNNMLQVETKLSVSYHVHSVDCEIGLENLSIISHENPKNYLLESTDMNIHINLGLDPSYYIAIPKKIVVNLTQANIQHFYLFFMNDLPKSPKAKDQLEIKTLYQVDYNEICINFLTKYREPLIKMILLSNLFKGVISSNSDVDIMSQISLEYFSPLVQEYECLMEPLEFQINYSYSTSPSPLSNLTISLVGEARVSFCLTDSLLYDLYSRFYGKVAKINACSVFNNTGHSIILEYNDNLTERIEDNETKQIRVVPLGQYLTLAVEQEGETPLYLNRVPLYTEGIHLHTLKNGKIDINTEVTISGQTKLIKVSSPIEIKNNTQIHFHVIFFSDDQESSTKSIYPNQIVSVPLKSCKGKVTFLPPNTPMVDCKQIPFSLIISSSPFCKSGDFAFALKYKKNTIHILPSICITNVLPTYIMVSFGNGIENIIEPNEFKDFFLPPVKTSVNLTVNGFNTSKSIMIFDKKISKTVVLKNEEYQTEIGLIYNEEENLKITFYPFYLISNLSMIPINFFIQTKSGDINISNKYRENKFFIGIVETLKVSVGDHKSKSLHIDSLNRNIFEITSKDLIFNFVHETVTAKLPGVNKYTKVFCVYSRVVVTNLMEQDVRIIQSKTDTKNFTYIKSKQKNYFNWVTYEQPILLMSIRVDGISSEWSGGFSINDSNTFYIKVENPKQNFFIKVEVKEENGIITVFLYNSYESDIKITNKCPFLIQAHQQDYHVPVNISPESFEYFTWYSVSLPDSIVVKFCFNEFWNSLNLRLDQVDRLLKFDVQDNPGIFIYVRVFKEANSHNVVVSTEPLERYENPYPSFQFSLIFPSIFLSFIQHEIYKKKEIVLISFTKFVLNLTQFTQCWDWKVGFSDVQFDSQIDKYVVCPIFFVSDGDQELMLSGKIIQSEKWICLEDFKLDMKNFIVNADSNLIESLVSFHKRFVNEADSSIDLYYISSAESIEIAQNAWIFLSKLQITSFLIKFSYKNLPNNVQDHFKSYLINFDNIMVFLESCNFSKLYGSPSSILTSISSVYKTMIMSNLDQILKQHGMLGGALMLALKFSNGIAKVGKKSKKKSKTEKQVYQEKLEQQRNNNTIRFTRCLKTTDLNSKALNQLKVKGGVDTFAEIVNNPVSGFMNLFKTKKKKEEEDENIVIKYKQRPNRVFYGRYSMIKAFNFEDCQVASMMKELNKEYENAFFYGQITGSHARNQKKIVLAVFSNYVAYVDHQSKIIWEISPIFIESIEKESDGLVIKGIDKKGKTARFVAPFIESELIARAIEMIKEVRRDMNN